MSSIVSTLALVFIAFALLERDQKRYHREQREQARIERRIPKGRSYSPSASSQNINVARTRRPQQEPKSLPKSQSQSTFERINAQAIQSPKPISHPVKKPVVPPDLASAQLATNIQKWKPNDEDKALLEELKHHSTEPNKAQEGQPIRRQNANVNTQYKLLDLAGDWQTAERLVASIREKCPTRSEQWCWEKAIWDLQRDRMR